MITTNVKYSLQEQDRTVEIAARVSGKGRPVVLFIHGIPTSSFLWRHVQEHLAPSARTIAVDLLGYGESDAPTDMPPTLPTQTRILHALMRQEDLTDVIVVGHDIGGGIAQLLALEAADRIAGMVLVDTIVDDSFPEPSIARLADPQWDRRILDVDLAAGFAKSLTKGTLLLDRGAILEAAHLYAAPFNREGGRTAYLRAARALHPEDLISRSRDIANIRVPTQIVWGEEDSFQPAHYGRGLAERLPNAELTVIPKGRHFLPEDHPTEIADTIRKHFIACP